MHHGRCVYAPTPHKHKHVHTPAFTLQHSLDSPYIRWKYSCLFGNIRLLSPRSVTGVTGRPQHVVKARFIYMNARKYIKTKLRLFFFYLLTPCFRRGPWMKGRSHDTFQNQNLLKIAYSSGCCRNVNQNGGYNLQNAMQSLF